MSEKKMQSDEQAKDSAENALNQDVEREGQSTETRKLDEFAAPIPPILAAQDDFSEVEKHAAPIPPMQAAEDDSAQDSIAQDDASSTDQNDTGADSGEPDNEE